MRASASDWKEITGIAASFGMAFLAALMFLLTDFQNMENVTNNLQRFMWATVHLIAPTSKLDVFIEGGFILVGILVEERLVGRNSSLFVKILGFLAIYSITYGTYLFFTAPTN